MTTAWDLEKMLERKLQPLVTSLDILTKSVDLMRAKYDKLFQKVIYVEEVNSKLSKKNKKERKLNTEVNYLSKKLKVCKVSLNNLEEYTRREYLEVASS